MSNETNNIDKNRRKLLKDVSTVAVAGTLVTGVGIANADELNSEEKQSEKKTGYRETQHIRDYYNTL